MPGANSLLNRELKGKHM